MSRCRRVTEFAYRKRPGSPCPACLNRGVLSFVSVQPWVKWIKDEETGEQRFGGKFFKCMNYLEGDRGCGYYMGVKDGDTLPYEWAGVPELVEPEAGARHVSTDGKGRRIVGRK